MVDLFVKIINKERAVLFILFLIVICGFNVYKSLPREMYPDVTMPVVYVSIPYEGVSPKDGERLIVRPVENELNNIEEIKKMDSIAVEGHVSIIVEFEGNIDIQEALSKVRSKVEEVRPLLPVDIEEPYISEINFSEFPILNVVLSGNISEYALVRIARNLKDRVESLGEVLEVDIAGDLEDTVEILVDPITIENDKIMENLFSSIKENNILSATGSINTKHGRYSVKLPGLLETVEDIKYLPIKSNGKSIILLSDLAQVKTGYKERNFIAHVNSKPAVVLEVVKRLGANIISTTKNIRQIVEEEKQYLPKGVVISYVGDSSKTVIQRINDLKNNLLLATLLVFIVIVYVIGIRSAFLVAISIPVTFLLAIVFLYFQDVSLNIIVLFALILSVGMIVDAAIVVTEYADRKILSGVHYKKSYELAVRQMLMPIFVSTLTTTIVFLPLLFWPGVTGEFMRFFPITLMATLTSSFLIALNIIPVLGKSLKPREKTDVKYKKWVHIIEKEPLRNLTGIIGKYSRLLRKILIYPGKFISLVMVVMVGIIGIYVILNKGVEFFPYIEPERARVIIRADGNLSITQKSEIAKNIVKKLKYLHKEVDLFYVKAGHFSKNSGGKDSLPSDTIAVVNLEYNEWNKRRKSKIILEEIRRKLVDMDGIIIETIEDKPGPVSSKDIVIDISSRDISLLDSTVDKILHHMQQNKKFIDVRTNRSQNSIEWSLKVDRKLLFKYGLSLRDLSNYIKLITNGTIITNYRPDYYIEEVDIVIRFITEKRNILELANLKIVTDKGAVPISNFITIVPKREVSKITRKNSKRVIQITADLIEGEFPAENIKILKKGFIKELNVGSLVNINFAGENEDREETGQFLTKAFFLVIIAMFLIFLFQFNSVSSAFVVMTAVFLSIIGVLIGLLLTGQAFGIVMCGVAVIALAGVVVNNNIILLDALKDLIDNNVKEESFRILVIRVCVQRLRPIFLTSFTTVLGLFPMIIGMNIDFAGASINFGSPSSQWWRQLSTAIAGGLIFSTFITLFLTPSFLLLFYQWNKKFDRFLESRSFKKSKSFKAETLEKQKL